MSTAVWWLREQPARVWVAVGAVVLLAAAGVLLAVGNVLGGTSDVSAAQAQAAEIRDGLREDVAATLRSLPSNATAEILEGNRESSAGSPDVGSGGEESEELPDIVGHVRVQTSGECVAVPLTIEGEWLVDGDDRRVSVGDLSACP